MLLTSAWNESQKVNERGEMGEKIYVEESMENPAYVSLPSSDVYLNI